MEILIQDSRLKYSAFLLGRAFNPILEIAMKKIALFTLFLTLLGVGRLMAEDETEKAAPKDSPKTISQKDISQGMSEVWCQKMEECSKDKSMGPVECKKILFKSFKTGFDNIPKGQKVDVSRENYEECMKNVQAGTCENLKSAQTLPGCDFITLLNRAN